MEGSPIVSEYTSGIFEKVFCCQIWPLFNSYTYPLHREVDFVKALWKIYWLSLKCTDSFPNETSLLIIVEWARKPCVRAFCLLNDKDERMVDFCIFFLCMGEQETVSARWNWGFNEVVLLIVIINHLCFASSHFFSHHCIFFPFLLCAIRKLWCYVTYEARSQPSFYHWYWLTSSWKTVQLMILCWFSC